jgi:hypothetical protein
LARARVIGPRGGLVGLEEEVSKSHPVSSSLAILCMLRCALLMSLECIAIPFRPYSSIAIFVALFEFPWVFYVVSART